MNRLLLFVMAVLMVLPVYSAEPYRLPFVEIQNGPIKIPFIQGEWVLGVDKPDWFVFLEKGMFKEHKDMYEFHAATVYKKPFYNDAIKTEVSKIYSYGVLNCKEANLYILFEWYVDPDDTMVFKGTHEFGAYVVEMLTPTTARNDIYNQICKETV